MRRVSPALAGGFAGRPGQLDILYANNEQEKAFQRQPGFVRLFLGQVRRSRVDAIADYRISGQPAGRGVRVIQFRGLLRLALQSGSDALGQSGSD